MEKNRNYYAWLIVLCAALMNLIFLGFAWNTNQLYMNSILTDYPSFTRASYALTVTFASIANTAFSMTFGTTIKKLGARLIIILGVCASVGGLLVYSAASSLPVFYAASLLIGTSIAFVTTTTSAMLVNNWFAKNNGTILAITTTASGIGGAIFPRLVAGWITDIGWRTSFLYTAIVCAVIGVLVILLVRITPESVGLKPMWAEEGESTQEAGGSPAQGLTMAQARKTKNFWCITILFFLMGIIIYSVQQSMAIYTNTLGFTTVQAGSVLSALFIANMCSQIPLGWLSDRLGVRKVMTTGLCVFLVALILLLMPGTGLGRMYGVGAMVGFSVVLMSVMVPIVVRDVFGPKDYAGILGFIIGIRTIGIAIGTPLINAFYDKLGSYQLIFILYLAGMAVCVVLAFVGTKKIDLESSGEMDSLNVAQ